MEPITVTESELTDKLAELKAGGWWVHRMDVKGRAYTLHFVKEPEGQQELKV